MVTSTQRWWNAYGRERNRAGCAGNAPVSLSACRTLPPGAAGRDTRRTGLPHGRRRGGGWRGAGAPGRTVAAHRSPSRGNGTHSRQRHDGAIGAPSRYGRAVTDTS